MKMTLEQLRVDSYSTQVSETELTSVKGGTTPAFTASGWTCVGIVVGVVTAVWQSATSSSGGAGSPGGGGGTTQYGVKIDSIANGTQYGVKIDSVRTNP